MNCRENLIGFRSGCESVVFENYFEDYGITPYSVSNLVGTSNFNSKDFIKNKIDFAWKKVSIDLSNKLIDTKVKDNFIFNGFVESTYNNYSYNTFNECMSTYIFDIHIKAKVGGDVTIDTDGVITEVTLIANEYVVIKVNKNITNFTITSTGELYNPSFNNFKGFVKCDVNKIMCNTPEVYLLVLYKMIGNIYFEYLLTDALNEHILIKSDNANDLAIYYDSDNAIGLISKDSNLQKGLYQKELDKFNFNNTTCIECINCNSNNIVISIP